MFLISKPFLLVQIFSKIGLGIRNGEFSLGTNLIRHSCDYKKSQKKARGFNTAHINEQTAIVCIWGFCSSEDTPRVAVSQKYLYYVLGNLGYSSSDPYSSLVVLELYKLPRPTNPMTRKAEEYGCFECPFAMQDNSELGPVSEEQHICILPLEALCLLKQEKSPLQVLSHDLVGKRLHLNLCTGRMIYN